MKNEMPCAGSPVLVRWVDSRRTIDWTSADEELTLPVHESLGFLSHYSENAINVRPHRAKMPNGEEQHVGDMTIPLCAVLSIFSLTDSGPAAGEVRSKGGQETTLLKGYTPEALAVIEFAGRKGLIEEIGVFKARMVRPSALELNAEFGGEFFEERGGVIAIRDPNNASARAALDENHGMV